MRKSVNQREVTITKPIAPPETYVASMSDDEYTCDNCGKVVLAEAERHELGFYAKDRPDGWRNLYGFDEKGALDFCSFSCQIAWLQEARWRPVIEAERARLRQLASDQPEYALKIGDA